MLLTSPTLPADVDFVSTTFGITASCRAVTQDCGLGPQRGLTGDFPVLQGDYLAILQPWLDGNMVDADFEMFLFEDNGASSVAGPNSTNPGYVGLQLSGIYADQSAVKYSDTNFVFFPMTAR